MFGPTILCDWVFLGGGGWELTFVVHDRENLESINSESDVFVSNDVKRFAYL